MNPVYNHHMIKRVYIEITNVCDLSCSFCVKNHRAPVFMEVPFFHDVLRQALTVTPHIYLHVQGEPMLHPAFDQILSVCDAEKASVHLVTNGSFLNRYPDLLTHSCLKTIAVSVQSASARPESSIRSYFTSVLELAERISAKGSLSADLRFWRSDADQDPNTSFCLNTLREKYSLQPTKRNNSYSILPNVYVSFANDFAWPVSSKSGSTSGTCLGGRMQIAVLSDGTVVPCCLDADGIIALGNLHQELLQDILKKPRYTELIRGFEQNHLSEALCRSCTYRHRFDQ